MTGMEKKIQEAVDLVEGICSPKKMAPEEAIEFLEGVVMALDASIDALNDSLD
jgi:hypothetical protein